MVKTKLPRKSPRKVRVLFCAESSRLEVQHFQPWLQDSFTGEERGTHAESHRRVGSSQKVEFQQVR